VQFLSIPAYPAFPANPARSARSPYRACNRLFTLAQLATFDHASM